MDNMPNGVTLQKQIASIMDVLAKAAVAEISKVVEDGVVMLRLEICERENEIDTLKRNLQIVSNELRATRRALVRECVSGRSRQLGTAQGGQSLDSGVNEKDKRGTEREPRNEDFSGQGTEITTTASGVKVKLEFVEDEEQVVQDTSQNTRTGLASHSSSTENERLTQVWSSEENTEIQSPECFHSTHQSQHRPDPTVALEMSYNPLRDRLERRCSDRDDVARHSEPSTDSLQVVTDALLRAENGIRHQKTHSYAHNTLLHPHPEGQSVSLPARGRQTNGGMDVDKRRFPCMFCGKSFDRLSHVERHQRIHTGEKPFSCRLCGRCFTQKSSLKSHLKTHRGFGDSTEAASGLPNEENHFSNEWNMAPHCEEQIAHHSYMNSQDTHSEEPKPHSSCLGQEATPFMNVEEESLEQPDFDHQPTLTETDSPAGRAEPCSDFCEDSVVCALEKDGMKTEKKEEVNEQTLNQPSTDLRPEESVPLHSGSESVMDEEDTQLLLPLNTPSTEKVDLVESYCSARTEHGLHKSKYQLEATSTIIHSWGTPANTNKSFGRNHIHVKEEVEDPPAVEEEKTMQERSHSMQSVECGVASPMEHLASAASLGTAEALMGPDLPCNSLPQRLLNGMQKKRERRFLCVLCGKCFDRLSHLHRHQRIHTGEKPYSCSTCGRSFTQKSSLKGHMRTHTRERAFHCSVCGMSFPSRASRYRHCCNQTDTTGYVR